VEEKRDMKVLIATDWYEPAVNGVVTSVVNLAHGLEAMGHDVRILTLSGNLLSYQKGNVLYIGSSYAGVFYPKARMALVCPPSFLQELKAWHPDIVHSQTEFSTFLFAKRIARSCHAPLVHTYHTVYEDFTHYFAVNVKLGKRMAMVFTRWALSRPKAVIVPTAKISRMLDRYGVLKPVYAIPTGLDMRRFLKDDGSEKTIRKELGLREDDFVFVFVGRLAKEKNVGELLDLMEQDMPFDAKLLIVGDGPVRKDLEASCAGKHLCGRVVFAGMVLPEKIAGYYRAGDVFVCASQSETQGLTYFEAMACGIPVLCKKDPCLDGVVDQGRNGFEYDSPRQFADIAKRLVSNPEERARIGQAARQTIMDHYTEEGFARAVCGVYHACLVDGNSWLLDESKVVS